MATPATTEADANYQQVVRVVRYVLEDLTSLDDDWFRHDNAYLEHKIERSGLGQGVLFSKQHFSNTNPPLIGFNLTIPLSTGLDTFVIWVLDPVANIARNKRATKGALERLRDTRNLKSVQVSTAQYP